MKIELPQNFPANNASLEAALSQRETKREYLDTPLSLNHLSQLLFAAQGRRGSGKKTIITLCTGAISFIYFCCCK